MNSRNLATSLSLALLAIASGCSGGPSGATDSPDGGGTNADAAPFTAGTSTLAGSSEAGAIDGNRATARFSNPVTVAYGRDGKVYVADFDNNEIRAIDPEGNVTTVVKQTGFQRPFGLLFLSDGTLLVSTDNDQAGGHSNMSGSVWKVDIAGQHATILANAIGRPRGLAQLPDGRVAIADEYHQVIRWLDLSSGAVTTLAGMWDAPGMVDANGAAARFSTPYGLTARPNNTFVVCDNANNRLRVVASDGSVSTLTGGAAGFADGALTSAQFGHPQAVVANGAGDLFVTDMDNYRVRKVSGGNVVTVSGDGTPGYRDSDNPESAELYGLEGLALTNDGSILFIADGNRGEAVPYNRIRQVKL